uniref:Uncharacterized protein n=1 Tax=Glossina pallidipes TaxID=7398 RepID=A0A1A9ZAC9_GLOPL
MVFPHIIGYLKYSVPDIETYHYTLLETMDILLRNASFTALQKIGNLRPGIVAGLQYPIENAGDFNTQLLALKLMTRLLKYADIEKQNQELKNVPWFNTKLIENDLSAVMKEANRGQFENVARELLNKYNMNLTMRPYKVYSLYCDYLCFQKNLEFYKPLNCDKFWINFNYSPRTLSFNGHYNKLMKLGYDTVHVTVKITALNLERKTLIVHYNEPVQLSKYSNVLEELNGYTDMCLFLSDEEVSRLKCNRDLFDHFNEHEYDNGRNRENSSCNSVSDESSSRHGDFSNQFRKSLNLLIGEANDNNNLTPMRTNQPVKATSEQRFQQPMDIIDANETPKTSKLSNTNVTKSHPIQRLRSNNKKSASTKKATTMNKKSTEAANSSPLASTSTSVVQTAELVNLNHAERGRNVSTCGDTSNYESINSTEFVELMSNGLLKTNKDNSKVEAINDKDHGAINESSNGGAPNISLIREPKSALFDTLSLRSNADGQVAMESINSSNYEIRLNPISDNGDNRNEETSNNSAQVVYASGAACLGKKEASNTLKIRKYKNRKSLCPRHLSTDKDYIIEKVNQITRKLLTEAGNQRVEMKEIKSHVQYLVRDLEGQLETYTNRFERFKRFEANIEQLLNDLYKKEC